MTTIFTPANVSGTPLLPNGISQVTNPSHVVSLTLSSGQTVQVGTVQVLMTLVRRMRDLGIYYLMPTEDLFVVRVGYAKLLVCEASFQNQKLLNAGSPCYEGGAVLFNMRSSAQTLSFDDALASVGHYRTLSSPYLSDWQLQQEAGDHNPRIRVVDYRYSVDASSATQGTQLVDSTPLQFG